MKLSELVEQVEICGEVTIRKVDVFGSASSEDLYTHSAYPLHVGELPKQIRDLPVYRIVSHNGKFTKTATIITVDPRLNKQSLPAQENESIYVIFCGYPITIFGYALSREEAINICEEHNKEHPVPRYAYLKIGRLRVKREDA